MSAIYRDTVKNVSIYKLASLAQQKRPTKRAPDAGDSGENLKQFSTPQHFSSWTAFRRPTQRG